MNNEDKYLTRLEELYETETIEAPSDDLIIMKSEYLAALKRTVLGEVEAKKKNKFSNFFKQIVNIKNLFLDNFSQNTGRKLKGFPVVGFIIGLLKR